MSNDARMRIFSWRCHEISNRLSTETNQLHVWFSPFKAEDYFSSGKPCRVGGHTSVQMGILIMGRGFHFHMGRASHSVYSPLDTHESICWNYCTWANFSTYCISERLWKRITSRGIVRHRHHQNLPNTTFLASPKFQRLLWADDREVDENHPPIDLIYMRIKLIQWYEIMAQEQVFCFTIFA